MSHLICLKRRTSFADDPQSIPSWGVLPSDGVRRRLNTTPSMRHQYSKSLTIESREFSGRLLCWRSCNLSFPSQTPDQRRFASSVVGFEGDQRCEYHGWLQEEMPLSGPS